MSAVLVLFLLCLVFRETICYSTITVNTSFGLIQGIKLSNLNKFIAIPYAKPPINDLRWANPESPTPWNNNTYKANKNYIPSCPQICDTPPNCPSVISEDCLYLNIYTPPLSSIQLENSTNYAVMIWIHGGSFKHGSGGGIAYDPTSILENINDIIIVTINYRLGLLGFLYDNHYKTGIDGNFGFFDQKLAIEWVHNNIQHFGGNPDQIMLFGESAGAHSIALHLLYNNDYISGGIMESPPLGIALRDNITWYDVPQQLTSFLDCDTSEDAVLDCWRSANVSDIISAQNSPKLTANWEGMPYTPTVGTDAVPEQPIAAWNWSDYDGPPFIIGANKDEAYLFINKSQGMTMNSKDLQSLLSVSFGNEENAKTIMKHYGCDNSNLDVCYGRIETDALFRCPVVNVTQNTNIMSKVDVYRYHFDIVNTDLYQILFGSNFPFCVNRTCHTAEISYVWLPVNYSLFGYEFDNTTMKIGEALQVYWTNFAKYLNPNGNDDGGWRPYSENDNVLVASEDITKSINASSWTDVDCSIWNDIGYAGAYADESGNHHKYTDSKGLTSAGVAFVVIICLIVAAIGGYVLFRWFIRKRNNVGVDKNQPLASHDYGYTLQDDDAL